jgi:hypothetical protein
MNSYNILLGLSENSYIHGTAYTDADYATVKLLEEHHLLEMDAGLEDCPNIKDCCAFIEKYPDKNIKLVLRVNSREHEDAGIAVVGMKLDNQHAWVNTNDENSIIFWKDYKKFRKCASSTMVEGADWTGMRWDHVR